MKKRKNSQIRIVVGALTYLVLLLALVYVSFSLPSAPSITHIKNETSASSGIGQARSGDEGGYITTLSLNARQQNLGWKAYVGNVSGRFVLEDSDAYSIYEWDMTVNAEGEVYIARNGSVDWLTVNCSNRTIIANEETFLNINGSSGDSINTTFNNSIHRSFITAGRTIQNSSCPSIATYFNATEAAQTNGEANMFQEVLLQDQGGNLIYTSLLDDDAVGFDNETYDFQAIIAEDESAGTPTTYYFYVELGA